MFIIQINSNSNVYVRETIKWFSWNYNQNNQAINTKQIHKYRHLHILVPVIVLVNVEKLLEQK